MEFYEKLQELRKSRGLTQEELAEMLSVSRTAISKWESGRGYPNIDSLKAISKCFSVAVLPRYAVLIQHFRNRKRSITYSVVKLPTVQRSAARLRGRGIRP